MDDNQSIMKGYLEIAGAIAFFFLVAAGIWHINEVNAEFVESLKERGLH